MSTTSTETQMAPPAEFTIIARVTSIPLVAESLKTIDGALSENCYTRFSYCTAKELSNSAISSVKPLQTRLSPLILKVDGYANTAVDAVESRCPYPFQAKPEEVFSLIQERRKSAEDIATTYYNETSKRIDENIRTPAINVAAGFDKRFSPLVDYYEVAVKRTSNSEAGPSTPPDVKYQYQRALALSRTLKDNIVVLSGEQLQQLRDQHAVLQRASDAAKAINDLAITSASSASTHIHKLSDSMISDIHKFQQNAASFSASITSSVHDSAAQLRDQIPLPIQQNYKDLTDNISAAMAELKNIVSKENITVQEKLNLAVQEVQNRVNPAIENIKQYVSHILSSAKESGSHAAARVDGS